MRRRPAAPYRAGLDPAPSARSWRGAQPRAAVRNHQL